MKKTTSASKQTPCRHSRKSRFPLTLVLPLLGIGSLLWFLFRVIPKPSRAAYPCMRVAAPFASTFVLWLLGIVSSLLFIKRARAHFLRSRYAAAAGCIVAGGIVAAVFLSSPHSPAFAAMKFNAPVGVAKGANPGRVVWAYDSAVSNWKGLGDGHWWEGNRTNQATVDRMLSRSLRELAGKPTDSAAWDTLFRYFNSAHGKGSVGYTKKEKIAIKANLVNGNHYPAFSSVDSMTYHLYKKFDFMSTSPQAIRALLRQLVYIVGVDQADISVGDPTAYYPFEYYDSCHAEFPGVHYLDWAGKFGRTKAEPSDVPVYWSCRPAGVKQDYVPKQFAEATYLINFANMKSHLGGGITLCAKNHYGSLRLPFETGYYDLHTSLAYVTPKMGSYRALVDMMGHAHLGGKTVLYLVDGLYAGNHNHDTVPQTWDVAPFNGGWTSSIFASQDPVAIECVLFDLFQLEKDSHQYPKIAGAEDYLVEAAKANDPPSGTFYDPNHATPVERLPSLGVFEHWNNATDRKYSRNLGTGDGIELVFVKGATNHIISAKSKGPAQSAYRLRSLPASSMVEFSIPERENVRLALFDGRGRMVRIVIDQPMDAGAHRVKLLSGAVQTSVSPGLYVAALYRTENGAGGPAAACAVRLAAKR